MSEDLRPGVAVLIVNYFSAADLSKCVATLKGQRHIASIFIYDNSCDFDERNRLDRISAGDARIRVLLSNHNVGFADALNALGKIALADSKHTHLWCLNPDTRVHPDCVAKLLDVEPSDELCIVSPLILDRQDRIWFAGGHPDLRRGVSWHHRKGEAIESHYLTGRHETAFITGAAPLFSRNSWLAVGGFPSDFFLYWEDAALSLRARELGMLLLVEYDARVTHLQGGSTGDGRGGNSPVFYYYNQRNRLLIAGGFRRRLSVALLLGSRETLRLLLKPLLQDTAPRFKKLRWSCMGVVDGLRGLTGPRDSAGTRG